MTTNVLMPALSPTMEQGKLAKWLKREGDAVRSGDVLVEIETDKATMEVEAADDGTLAKILVPDGTENVAVNTPIAVIAAEGENAALADAQQSPSVHPPPETRPQPLPTQEPAAAAPAKEPGPEIPEGVAMITQSVREALCDAMAEEMRRDGDVFIIGEEVAEY